MKRQMQAMTAVFLMVVMLPVRALGAQQLIPGGQILGLQVQSGAVTVAAFDDALGEGARAAGVKIGDEILAVNGREVSSPEDVRQMVAAAGERVQLQVCRSGKERTLTLEPRQTPEGPRLGLHLKQGISGIGTVTWYDPAGGRFGALGHGVSDSRGVLLEMTRGRVFHGEILSVKKGRAGDPGLLRGSAEAEDVCGRLIRNTPQGVFGIASPGWKGEPMALAEYDGIHTGEAAIRSTVSGSTVREYSVEILKIYPRDRTDGRNFLLKVTDPALLDATGGIVQGMSGSPIIQDGKLVGAVTHVLVNDPTRGYGIFIENMLTAAS